MDGCTREKKKKISPVFAAMSKMCPGLLYILLVYYYHFFVSVLRNSLSPFDLICRGVLDYRKAAFCSF